MATMQSAATSLEAFLALPDKEGVRRELDQGEVIEVGSPSAVHQILVITIGSILRQVFLSTTDSWRVAAGIGFKLSSEVIRHPDIFAARRETLDGMARVPGNYRVGAPELVVEVVSPTDAAEEIHRKTHQYLGAGAGSVWLVYAESRHVMVLRADRSIVEYRAGETIEEPGVSSGLSVAVDEIFADLD